MFRKAEKQQTIIVTCCQISHCDRRYWLEKRKPFLEKNNNKTNKKKKYNERTETPQNFFLDDQAKGGCL